MCKIVEKRKKIVTAMNSEIRLKIMIFLGSGEQGVKLKPDTTFKVVRKAFSNSS